MTIPRPATAAVPASLDRRRFLALLGAGAAGLAACTNADGVQSSRGPVPGGSEPTTTNEDGATDHRAATDPTAGSRVATDRVLVLLDLQGGSDGLSTVVPYQSGAYRDARPTLAVPGEAVLPLDDEVGLHPRLTRLGRRGVTTVEGVGPIDGNLSHFAMQGRWEQGDVRGSGARRDGFLARLVAGIDHGPDDLVGVSVGGPTPQFSGALGNTLTMATSTDLRFLNPSAWSTGPASLTTGLASFADRGDALGSVASSYRRLLAIADRLDDVAPSVASPPQLDEAGELGHRLAAAAELITADVGVRVVYAQLPGWDTHQGHLFTHDNLLRILDAAIDGFLELLEGAGWGDRVVVATTTEFGRRVAENGTGFDHGTSSTMLLFGQGDLGRFGDRPSLTDLDQDGNQAVTIGFDRYLATLAQEWLGLDAAPLVGDGVDTLGIFA